MSIRCDVILKPDASPAEVAAVAAGLWHWCATTAGSAGMYRHINDQVFADLLQGKLPPLAPSEATGGWAHRFQVRDRTSSDRRATILGLRREVPAGGVEDILVGGASWDELAAPGSPAETSRADPTSETHP